MSVIRRTAREAPVAAMIVVDFERALDVVAVGCVVSRRQSEAVEDVAAVVGFGTFDDVISPVGTEDEDEDEVDFAEEVLLTISEAVASPVTLTTRIAPKPGVRVKFCDEQSEQAKVPRWP